MPLIVTCTSCQKKLTVADQAGRPAGQVSAVWPGRGGGRRPRPRPHRRVAAVLTVKCPTCSRPMQYRADMAGKLLKCPGCGKGVKVPGGAAPPRPAAADDWIDITEEYLPPTGAASVRLPAATGARPCCSGSTFPRRCRTRFVTT